MKLEGLLLKAAAAAETLTGKRFALLVASSLVATSGIVAAGMSSSGGIDGLTAAAAARLLGEETVSEAPSPAEPAAPTSPAPDPGSSDGAGPSEPLPAPTQTPEPAPTPEPEASPPAAEPKAPASPIQHVFLISLASPGYEATWGATASQMPYLSGTLRPQGALLLNYSLLDLATLPNSIAAVSGQPPNEATKGDCATYSEFASASTNARGVVSGEGCIYPVETLTLADQLVGARLRWHGYLEGMQDEEGHPDHCVHPEPEAAEIPSASGYSARLNPFVFFHSLLDLGDCTENDVPLSELAKDLKKAETTANFSYISPNLCNAGFSGQCGEGVVAGPAAADAFLAAQVPKILASPAYKEDGLLIIAFGALDPMPPGEPAAPPPADPLGVGALLVSPLLPPGSTDTAPYNPYSLLRSTEDLLGLSPLARAGGTKIRSFSGAFDSGSAGD